MTPGKTANGAAVPGVVIPPPVFQGQRQESIIPPDVKHVIVAAGFYGSGKTCFVCGIDHPDNLLMLDFEGKGSGIANQLGILNYFPVVQEVATVKGDKYKPVDTFDRVMQILASIPNGRFTVLILDGLTILQQAALEQVKKAPVSYGVDPQKAVSGSMGGAWPGVSTVMTQIFNIARSKGIEVVGVTTEVKAKWGSQGPLLGKFEIKGVDVLHKMSVLTVLMVPGDPKNQGAPAGLVMKEQLAKVEWSKEQGRMVVTKRLPPRLPIATMAEVYGYLSKPANFSALRAEEIPSEEEMEPFKQVISKDQLGTMLEFIKLARIEAGLSADDVTEETL